MPTLLPGLLQAVPAALPTILLPPPPSVSALLFHRFPSLRPGLPAGELLRSAHLDLHATGLVLLGGYL